MSFEMKDFDQDVLVRSREIPVLVDFWAPWCGPCRILGPVLERLASESPDTWTLVKVNTESDPDLGARYGVRGIPDVRLFVDGEVVDGFMGALPEPAIREWLARTLPSPEDRAVAETLVRVHALGESPEALVQLELLVAQYPDRSDVRFMLARRVLFSEPARAASLMERLEPRGVDPSAVEGVRTVARSLAGVSVPGVQEVLDRALPRFQAGDMDQGLSELVIGVSRGDGSVRDALRGLVVAIFHLLGHDDPLTIRYRQALSQALYV